MIQIQFAEKCAWRAIYIRVGQKNKHGDRPTQIAHLGIDPTFNSGPAVFGGVYLNREWQKSFRFKVPVISWQMIMKSNYNEKLVKLYGLQQTFFHKLDGRY